MNEYSTFLSGVADATADLRSGWLAENVTLDFIVSEFRSRLGCSDSYLAGYLSVVFG